MKAQRIHTLLLAAAVLGFVMPRVASASGLVENWDSLASWQTMGDARIEPADQLLLRGNPSVTSAYRTDFTLGTPDSYRLTVLAKVDSYTAGAENLGFKVSGGMRRLMFQRRSDGFYAITSTSGDAWVQVHPTSEYTGWGEYEFTVTKGEVSLRTRRFNGIWDRPTTWTLPPYGAENRVEVWVKGTSGDAHVDRLTLTDLASAESTITFINENATQFPDIRIYIDCQTVLGKWQKVCAYQQAQGERYASVVSYSGRELWTDGAVAGEVYLAKLENEGDFVESVTATPQDQTVHVKLRSKSSANPVKLTLVNTSLKAEDVFWYDYQGNKVKYATLKPGQGYTQATYATHPWSIGDHYVRLYIPNSQAEQTNVSSYDISTPVKVKFVNSMPLPVDLYWVDYQGKQVKYATIMPFSSGTTDTFFSHPWIARLAGTETILGFYVPEAEPALQTYVIGSQ